MMINILLTGSTGNVGKKVIKYLGSKSGEFQILAGVREVDKGDYFSGLRNVQPIHFDFEDEQSIKSALDQSDILFLLRPPQLADVKKYFYPMINLAKDKNIQHIVFLSVQGADKNSLIPHHKIEKLNFQQMAAILSETLGREIKYKSPILFSFYLKKRKEKVPVMLILVMIMLHYLPRFKPVPATTDWVKDITGNKPGTFKAFAAAHKSDLEASN
jgi:uncharacterized protein YbjT (DUF2867 family)